MNWTTINEKLNSIGAAVKDAATELVNEVKDDLRPKTYEEKVDIAIDTIRKNPDLSHAQIVDILDEIGKKSKTEETIADLKEKLRWGYSDLKKALGENEGLNKLKEKVDALLESDKIEEIKQTIDAQNRLKKAVDYSKTIAGVFSTKLNEALDEISKSDAAPAAEEAPKADDQPPVEED
jgi:virulence-associated protein VapD